jgi:hypothetical protein
MDPLSTIEQMARERALKAGPVVVAEPHNAELTTFIVHHSHGAKRHSAQHVAVVDGYLQFTVDMAGPISGSGMRSQAIIAAYARGCWHRFSEVTEEPEPVSGVDIFPEDLECPGCRTQQQITETGFCLACNTNGPLFDDYGEEASVETPPEIQARIELETEPTDAIVEIPEEGDTNEDGSSADTPGA